MGPKEAMALLDGATELVAAKGKRVERIDLRKGKPDKATVTRLMIGPSGNLRAPTVRVGKRILVGFDEESYERFSRWLYNETGATATTATGAYDWLHQVDTTPSETVQSRYRR